MELRHLRYFLAVAEELHFGRAAARLHIAQPALSIQIRELERELGVTLLARTNRRVELTEPGCIFLDGARRTLAQLDVAVNDAQRAARGQIGRLRIGFVSSSSYELLPRLLGAFRKAYPKVVLRLQAATTNEQVAALTERRLDLGLLRLPISDAALEWRALAEEPLVAALPAAHPLATQARIPLSALAEEAFILYPRADNSVIHDAIIACCRRAGFSPRITQESGDMQAITALVASGLGVALVIATPGLRVSPDVALRPLAGHDIPAWQMALAWRREAELAPAVRAFVDLTEALLQQADATSGA